MTSFLVWVQIVETGSAIKCCSFYAKNTSKFVTFQSADIFWSIWNGCNACVEIQLYWEGKIWSLLTLSMLIYLHTLWNLIFVVTGSGRQKFHKSKVICHITCKTLESGEGRQSFYKTSLRWEMRNLRVLQNLLFQGLLDLNNSLKSYWVYQKYRNISEVYTCKKLNCIRS